MMHKKNKQVVLTSKTQRKLSTECVFRSVMANKLRKMVTLVLERVQIVQRLRPAPWSPRATGGGTLDLGPYRSTPLPHPPPAAGVHRQAKPARCRWRRSFNYLAG
jgi:hypothetical protein